MIRRISALALTLGVAASLASPTAFADQFTPTNDPPTVENLVLPSAMQPASPRSTAVYTLTATVGSQGTVSNLKTVTMCIYKSGASQTCDNASTDPKHEFSMVWTQSTNSFSVVGTNNYRNAGSDSDYGDGTGLTMDINFKFKISDAMVYGEDWNVSIVAIDQQDQGQLNDPIFSSSLEASGLVVLYFGTVTTQRSTQAFGNLSYGGGFSVEAISLGSFIANEISAIYLAASDFEHGVTTIDIEETYNTPSTGKVLLACHEGATYSSGIQIGNSPTLLTYNKFIGGTGETADTSLEHSCRLEYGGGASVANVQYANTVAVSIGPGF